MLNKVKWVHNGNIYLLNDIKVDTLKCKTRYHDNN